MTGNIVLVNGRKVTMEVITLGSDRILRPEDPNSLEERYVHNGENNLYSAYNPNHEETFKHYLQYFPELKT